MIGALATLQFPNKINKKKTKNNEEKFNKYFIKFKLKIEYFENIISSRPKYSFNNCSTISIKFCLQRIPIENVPFYCIVIPQWCGTHTYTYTHANNEIKSRNVHDVCNKIFELDENPKQSEAQFHTYQLIWIVFVAGVVVLMIWIGERRSRRRACIYVGRSWCWWITRATDAADCVLVHHRIACNNEGKKTKHFDFVHIVASTNFTKWIFIPFFLLSRHFLSIL